MRTKACKLKDEIKKLYFTNYDLVPEYELFLHVLEVLKSCDDIEIKEKKLCPTEDIYPCKIGKKEFELVYDIDYGLSIYSDDEEVLEQIAKLFD